MQQFMTIARALDDENRVRILLSLREGELCLCQVVAMLGLSPSTVSKHVDLLRQAGLVLMRKQGRWHYYRLAGRDAVPMVREAIRWVLRALADEHVIVADAARLGCIRETNPSELTGCYTAR